MTISATIIFKIDRQGSSTTLKNTKKKNLIINITDWKQKILSRNHEILAEEIKSQKKMVKANLII